MLCSSDLLSVVWFLLVECCWFSVVDYLSLSRCWLLMLVVRTILQDLSNNTSVKTPLLLHTNSKKPKVIPSFRGHNRVYLASGVALVIQCIHLSAKSCCQIVSPLSNYTITCQPEYRPCMYLFSAPHLSSGCGVTLGCYLEVVCVELPGKYHYVGVICVR